MLFRQKFLDGIRDGSVTLAFRRWRRPSVKAGGTLLTAVGQLGIAGVRTVSLDEISPEEARWAGFSSREELLVELAQAPTGDVYRIDLGPLRPDPRVALREELPTAQDLDHLVERLRRLDSHADEPWTLRVLELLAANPAVRAGDLCGQMGQDLAPFKIDVRKLKALGLTESLEVGYRLSPRGRPVLEYLRSGGGDEVRSPMRRQTRFPTGWDEQRVRDVLEHYENQTDEEAAAEHEAALPQPDTD